jgi:hypothetical protein
MLPSLILHVHVYKQRVLYIHLFTYIHWNSIVLSLDLISAIHYDIHVHVFNCHIFLKEPLKRLAPEPFSSTAQNAIIYYWMVRYRSHWCKHIAHVLLNSNQVQQNVQVQILIGFCRDYILGRKVTSARKFEIWKISQFLHHQRNHQYSFS